MNPAKIFVADEVSDIGLQPLRDAGFTIDKRTDLSSDSLREALSDAEGLVVRSATKVTDELMGAAPKLRVIGRAGVGVDNINVPAATARGIVVMNAPDGNTITTAEHTIALMVALARNVAQANSSVKAANWDRKRFIGAELSGKTLGIIGLGRIGRAVAERAAGLGMKVVAHDPFVGADQARDAEVETASLDEVLARADFLTIHTPLTTETRGLVNAEAIVKMKQGARIINCARGGLVDESALHEAIKSGKIAGAALDVFEQEPPPADHPLLQLDEVIVTPHLGASTAEAQEAVAFTVAEQMRDYLLSGALRSAVNMPTLGAKELAMLQPYLFLAERLGRFQAQLVESTVREVRVECAAELVKMDLEPVVSAFLMGFLRDVSARVNMVNALFVANERGMEVIVSCHYGADQSVPTIRTNVIGGGVEQSLSGTVFTLSGGLQGRITEISGFHVEAIPRGHMLVTRNRDVPGIIGKMGTILGDARVNISRFHLGRNRPGGEAIAVIETDDRINDATLRQLLTAGCVLSAKRIEL